VEFRTDPGDGKRPFWIRGPLVLAGPDGVGGWAYLVDEEEPPEEPDVAFPQVESVTTSAGTTATATVDMPESVDAGDLLLILLQDFGSDITSPDGWTELYNATHGTYPNGRCAVFVKKAAGTEGGGSVSITLGSYQYWAALTYRISAWSGTITDVEATGTTGLDDSPNPPSETATWGSADNLFLALAGAGDDDATFSAAPTNYSNLQQQAGGGGSNNSCEVAGAEREYASASDNPGTFTLSEIEAWHAITVVIKPAAAGGTTAPTGALSGPLVGALGGPIGD